MVNFIIWNGLFLNCQQICQEYFCEHDLTNNLFYWHYSQIRLNWIKYIRLIMQYILSNFYVYILTGKYLNN